MLKNLKPKTILNIVILLIAIGLISYSGAYFLARHKSLHQPVPSPKAVVGTAVGEPAETPVDTGQTTYNVAADKPKLISLPSIDSEGFVQQVAVDNKNNTMAVPNNIYFAGWYVKSVKPGDAGLSIINGHVSGRYQPGIFKHLSKLEPGATFYVDFGDGSRRNFTIVTNQTYRVDQVAQYLYSKDPAIDSQLNLITCAGQYNSATREYDKRALVVAKRV